MPDHKDLDAVVSKLFGEESLSPMQAALYDLIAVAVDVLDGTRNVGDLDSAATVFAHIIRLSRKSCPLCNGGEQKFGTACKSCEDRGWVWRNELDTTI